MDEIRVGRLCQRPIGRAIQSQSILRGETAARAPRCWSSAPSGGSGSDLDHGAAIRPRVIFLDDAHPIESMQDDVVAAIVELRRMDDDGAAADWINRRPAVVIAFPSRLQQHHAEAPVGLERVRDHRAIPRLEDVKRQWHARKEHDVRQRKQRQQSHDGYRRPGLSGPARSTLAMSLRSQSPHCRQSTLRAQLGRASCQSQFNEARTTHLEALLDANQLFAVVVRPHEPRDSRQTPRRPNRSPDLPAGPCSARTCAHESHSRGRRAPRQKTNADARPPA